MCGARGDLREGDGSLYETKKIVLWCWEDGGTCVRWITLSMLERVLLMMIHGLCVMQCLQQI